MLRDDKTYPYIRVTVGEDFPRVLFSRQQKKDRSRYFGPYTSAGAVKDTIELINKLYQLRTCNRNLPKDIGKDRPCLNYHIHQCNAPCQGYISKEEYRQRVDAAVEFLNGNYAPILKSLQEKMMAASEEMQFEKAIEYRDLLNSVKQIAQKQKITHNDGEDKDIIALAADDRDAVVQVFFIRDGKLIGRDHFYVKIGNEDTKEQILTTFVKQFYSGTPFIPREIMLPEEIDDHEVLAEWLGEKRGGKVYIRIPQKGMKEKLVELAQKNAELVLSQDKEKIKREEGRTIGAMKEIAGWRAYSVWKRLISPTSTDSRRLVPWWFMKKENQSAAITESSSSALSPGRMTTLPCMKSLQGVLHTACGSRKKCRRKNSVQSMAVLHASRILL